MRFGREDCGSWAALDPETGEVIAEDSGKGQIAMEPRKRAMSASARATLLGTALRAARVRSPYGLNELARRIGVRPATLSGWELGQRAAPPLVVAYILGTLGVVDEDKRRILALATMTASEVLITGKHYEHDRYAMLADCGATAKSVFDWHPLVIPDLVQHNDYAREALSAAGATEAEVHFVGALGAEHRELVHSKQLTAYIGEAALAQMIGSPETVLRQFAFLTALAAPTSKLSIRVVESGSGGHPGLMGAFTLYDTSSGPVVHLPNHGAAVFMPDDGTYRNVLCELDSIALSKGDSRVILDKYAREHRSRLRRSA